MEEIKIATRRLMGPGPSTVPQSILEALAQPTMGHLDPLFIRIMDQIRELQRYAFQSDSPHTFTLSAPGSAGMEACLVNMLEPGDEILVCINGVFGTRMAEISRRAGAAVTCLEFEWGQAVDPQQVEDALNAAPNTRLLAFVHAETSTGVLSDAQALAEIGHRHDCLVVVDAVTSLAGVPLRVDEWGLDAVYSGSQKCLSCVPGISPVVFSEAAWSRIEAREAPAQSWFLDLKLLAGYWSGGGRRAYHHTAPVNAMYAWHEALRLLREETLEESWKRHARHHRALREGLEALGMRFVVSNPEQRLPQLNAITLPEGIDEAQIRSTLLNEFDLEIGAGLGAWAGKAWRIGLMGNSCREDDVMYCLSALGTTLARSIDVSATAGSDAARAHYNATCSVLVD
jgi:alanine-glyoxylate transaminase/serine-glyoxylate transaminase/serine-pyruvate transaminase